MLVEERLFPIRTSTTRRSRNLAALCLAQESQAHEKSNMSLTKAGSLAPAPTAALKQRVDAVFESSMGTITFELCKKHRAIKANFLEFNADLHLPVADYDQCVLELSALRTLPRGTTADACCFPTFSILKCT